MNFKTFLLIAAFIYLAKITKQNLLASPLALPVNITVLYKPLHHSSRTFFLESLKPLISNLNHTYLQLNLIPAGDSVIGSAVDNSVKCASPDQCTAMEFQACALELFTKTYPQLVFNFIYCTFKNKLFAGAFSAAEKCAKEELSEGQWTEIYVGCVSTEKGRKLLVENVRKTEELFPQGLPAVPTVILNDGQVISKAENLDLGVFKFSVCNLIPVNFAHPWCNLRVAKKIRVRVLYESTSALSKVFFTKQLDPWCVYLEEMITLELYPAGNIPLSETEDKTQSFGNRLLSVVNDRYINNKLNFDGDTVDGFMRTLWFHTCFYNSPYWKGGKNESTEMDLLEVTRSCAKQSLPKHEWFSLYSAVNSKEGDETYAKVVNYTKKFKADNGLGDRLNSIPYVTIRESPLHNRRAANDLFLTVCSLYPSTLEGVNRPVECTPVEVKVFYSAADLEVSAKFFLNQLPPVFWRRRQRINLTLVPYFGLPVNGSSTIEEDCNQNLISCALNTAHACAVKMYFETGDQDSIQWDGKNQTLAFISCTFEKMLTINENENLDNINQIIEYCTAAHFISSDLLSFCTQGQEKKLYLEEMKNRTLKLQENLWKQLPVVFINGKEDYRAKTNFKAAVCEAMVGDKLDYCLQNDNDNGSSSSSLTKLIISTSFIILIILPLHLLIAFL